MSQIGTLNEKSLHASLKQYYAQPGDEFEVKLDRFVIDIVRGEQLIEIQTRNLGAMKRKLIKLLETHKIHLVHPIAATKWIVKPVGDGTSRRRSPKRGRVEHIFNELVYIPTLIAHPNLTIEVAMIEEEEKRVFDGARKRRRRKGWRTEERFLLDVVAQHIIHTPADLIKFLPPDLPIPFTTADVASGLRQPRRLAQQITYTLRALELIKIVGKKGNAILYEQNV